MSLSPAGPLIREHRLIMRMVDTIERSLGALQRDEGMDPAFVDTAVDFIRSYADRCHHGKEEDILFRVLGAKPLPAELRAEMDELAAEHVYARGVTRELAAANVRYADGDDGARAEVETRLRELCDFYPRHIEKEDRHFFKPAVEALSGDERARMLEDFRDFDASLIHERYRAAVEGCETGRR